MGAVSEHFIGPSAFKENGSQSLNRELISSINLFDYYHFQTS